MESVSKTQLQQWINGSEDMLLVDVLSKDSFNKQHIPGSINVPVKDNANFVKDIESSASSKSQRIVVYCANAQCDASEQAAQKLENAGFKNIIRFEEGVEGWFGNKAAA